MVENSHVSHTPFPVFTSHRIGRERRRKEEQQILFRGVGECFVLSLSCQSPQHHGTPGGSPAYGIVFNDIHWFQPS